MDTLQLHIYHPPPEYEHATFDTGLDLLMCTIAILHDKHGVNEALLTSVEATQPTHPLHVCRAVLRICIARSRRRHILVQYDVRGRVEDLDNARIMALQDLEIELETLCLDAVRAACVGHGVQYAAVSFSWCCYVQSVLASSW